LFRRWYLQSIQQIERVTQSTAATAEENAAAGDELNAQAVASMAVVRQLEALVDGTARPIPQSRATQPGDRVLVDTRA
jgi:methyl-accepting chemotaxis protein